MVTVRAASLHQRGGAQRCVDLFYTGAGVYGLGFVVVFKRSSEISLSILIAKPGPGIYYICQTIISWRDYTY